MPPKLCSHTFLTFPIVESKKMIEEDEGRAHEKSAEMFENFQVSY
jgi:hypothetical protein